MPNCLPSLHRQCVEISPCGNFGILGYSSGHVDIYNMQSGLYRGSIGGDQKAHSECIRGVVVDNLNQIMITASADSYLKFWYYKSKTLLSKIHFKSPITKIVLHRERFASHSIIFDVIAF